MPDPFAEVYSQASELPAVLLHLVGTSASSRLRLIIILHHTRFDSLRLCFQVFLRKTFFWITWCSPPYLCCNWVKFQLLVSFQFLSEPLHLFSDVQSCPLFWSILLPAAGFGIHLWADHFLSGLRLKQLTDHCSYFRRTYFPGMMNTKACIRTNS